jgi:hypothetical protein
MEGEDALLELAALEKPPQQRVFKDQLRETRSRVSAALDKVMRALPAEDYLLVKMAILNGVKIATIARTYCMDQKPLYRRLANILKGLRIALEQEDVRWEQVADLLSLSDLGEIFK